jgi:hypothetical protein
VDLVVLAPGATAVRVPAASRHGLPAVATAVVAAASRRAPRAVAASGIGARPAAAAAASVIGGLAVAAAVAPACPRPSAKAAAVIGAVQAVQVVAAARDAGKGPVVTGRDAPVDQSGSHTTRAAAGAGGSGRTATTSSDGSRRATRPALASPEHRLALLHERLRGFAMVFGLSRARVMPGLEVQRVLQRAGFRGVHVALHVAERHARP